MEAILQVAGEVWHVSTVLVNCLTREDQVREVANLGIEVSGFVHLLIVIQSAASQENEVKQCHLPCR